MDAGQRRNASDRLRRGDVYTIQVVIPEGYNLFDVAGAIEAAGLAPVT